MGFQCVFWNGRTEKHQTSTAVFLADWKNWVTQPLPRSLCAVSTSTPKPRAEGSSPSAPAKNREVSRALTSLFFVSVQKDSATRCARRPTCGSCRGGLQPCGLRPGPTEPAGETESGLNVIAFFADVLIRYHLSSPALIPSSTQNAPGFAFFGLFQVRFCVFRSFGRAKFWDLFLCTLTHSVTG